MEFDEILTAIGNKIPEIMHGKRINKEAQIDLEIIVIKNHESLLLNIEFKEKTNFIYRLGSIYINSPVKLIAIPIANIR